MAVARCHAAAHSFTSDMGVPGKNAYMQAYLPGYTCLLLQAVQDSCHCRHNESLQPSPCRGPAAIQEAASITLLKQQSTATPTLQLPSYHTACRLGNLGQD